MSQSIVRDVLRNHVGDVSGNRAIACTRTSLPLSLFASESAQFRPAKPVLVLSSSPNANACSQTVMAWSNLSIFNQHRGVVFGMSSLAVSCHHWLRLLPCCKSANFFDVTRRISFANCPRSAFVGTVPVARFSNLLIQAMTC